MSLSATADTPVISERTPHFHIHLIIAHFLSVLITYITITILQYDYRIDKLIIKATAREEEIYSLDEPFKYCIIFYIHQARREQ